MMQPPPMEPPLQTSVARPIVSIAALVVMGLFFALLVREGFRLDEMPACGPHGKANAWELVLPMLAVCGMVILVAAVVLFFTRRLDTAWWVGALAITLSIAFAVLGAAWLFEGLMFMAC
jgi:hypothetical protein